MEIDKAIHCIESFDTEELKGIDFCDPYIISYPGLINACQLLIKDLGNKSILPISHLAYGWMPTIISYNEEGHEIDKFENLVCNATNINENGAAISLLNSLPNNSPVNNSWIGLSKVLHFINPDLFPIWDSRVAKCFNMVYPYQFNKKDTYIKYCEFISNNLDSEKVKVVKDIYESGSNYEISRVRALEFLLFTIGPKVNIDKV
tara:strand:- start:259 stop:870 length:612 start_codon:yes stop_codon:yes gene_type:complete